MSTFKIDRFQKYYNDSKLAKEDLLRGHIWGFIQFNENFTKMISVRFDDAISMSENEIQQSTIPTTMDMSGNF